ncbi:MAG: cytochrome c maturation protein CcmE [Acidimicrobiia bacterium]
MQHRRFVLLGIGGVITLIVALTLVGLDQNLTYYLYPTEAVDRRAEFPDGERFRLAGMVIEGTLERGDVYTFEVTDGGAVVPVVLHNAPPPLFAEGVPVLLEGSWSGDVFDATQALIRHDENYEIPEPGGSSAGA